MMVAVKVGILIILFSLSAVFSGKIKDKPETKAGYKCAACTIGLSLVLQYGQVHNASISDAFERVCHLFNDPAYKASCEKVVVFIAPLLVQLVENHIPPDTVCTSLYVCPEGKSKKQPMCHLYPQSEDDSTRLLKKGREIVHKYMLMSNMQKFPSFCDWPGVSYICKLIESIFSRRTPMVDLDNDGFSSSETLRGFAWRGKDCNELDANHYPGRRPIDDDREFDSNCNGIYGVDRKTGIPYEKLYCEGTEPRGIVLLGDSAGAHFHIPDDWFYPPNLNKDTLSHLSYAIANECDWPMLSAGTGYRNITWSIIEDDTISFYQMIRERNLCNHRNYQNLGVNGADSNAAIENIKSLRRNQTEDYPVIFTFEFVGNDVCNYFDDTIAYMTTVEQMKSNVREILDTLEKTLPKGSHAVMMGLADGRILYNSLHNRFHPLGRLNKNIKYPEFYDYLTCVGVNPCNGWMSTNATLRDFTSQRAWDLSKAIQEVVEERKNKYRNFDAHYVDCPLNQIFIDWEATHGPDTAYQLIETVDGFHPNKLANILFAQYMWRYTQKHFPEYLGDINPNNDKIRELFGDQGGHY